MRFVSKNTNLMIVLRSGLNAQPLTGTPARPTLSVRFKDGMADVSDAEMVELMLKHPGYNQDYVSVAENAMDPYQYARAEQEPAHIITELKYGTPAARIASKENHKLSPELLAIIKETATSMAEQMLPGMVEHALKGLVSAHAETKAAEVKAEAEAEAKDEVAQPVTPKPVKKATTAQVRQIEDSE